MERLLREELGRALGLAPEAVDGAQPFERMGLDSVALATLGGRIAERLQRDLDPGALYDHPTLDALLGHLRGGR